MLNELKNVLDKDFDYNNLVNSTLDIKKNSVLLINNDSETRLDELVLDAINKNVKNIITSKNCTLANSKIVKVENYEKTFNELLIKLCKNFDKKNYFGITGTNGKTTTGYYLNQLIKNKSIFIGTTEEDLFKNITNEEHLTTPKLFNILKLLSKEENKDINDVVIEVSSHALDQERLKGIYFKVSGFTNLSQDHFDYHKNIDNYFASKLKMFTEDSSEKFVYVDSEWGNKLKHESKLPSFSIGYKSNNNLYIEKINVDKESFDLEFYLDGKKYEISVPLSGPLAHMNYLLALSMAYFSEQYKLSELLEASADIKNPLGRYEIFSIDTNDIIIDYAHTPESIKQSIAYVKGKYKNTTVIFGAGGNRDKDKRPLMGDAVNEADKIIITNDNPRDENEEDIAKDILEGVNLNKDVEVVLNRKEAIRKGIENLKNDSVLLILGKGHEKIQEFENNTIKFSDQQVVKEMIKEIQ